MPGTVPAARPSASDRAGTGCDRDDGLQSTRRSLPIALLRAREAVMARFRPILAEHSVTEQQWRVIRVLGESSPRDATAVADHCCILMPSMTRIIRALQERGLITRKRDAADGRKLVLAITPAGRALLDQVAPHSLAVYRDIEARYGSGRVETLLDMLEDLALLGGR